MLCLLRYVSYGILNYFNSFQVNSAKKIKAEADEVFSEIQEEIESNKNLNLEAELWRHLVRQFFNTSDIIITKRVFKLILIS